MKTWNAWVWRTVAASGMALMIAAGGCATPRLADVTAVEDDDSAYLVFGAQNRTEQQAQVAQRMVQRAYNDVARLRPVDRAGPLDAWADFLAALERPLPVNTERYRTARELRDIGDIHLVARYIRNNPSLMQLHGPDWSADWKRDLEDARAVVNTLRRTVAAARRNAAAAVRENDMSAALESILNAYAIAPKETAIRREAQRIQDELATHLLDDMQQSLKTMEELVSQIDVDAIELPWIMAAEDQLASVIDRLTVLTRGMTRHRIPLSDRAVGEGILASRNRVMELSGPTWAASIRLHGRARDYWGAYELTRASLSRIKGHPVLAQTDAESNVLAAYANMMTAGVAHLLEESNDLFYSDRFGLAYIAARMSRELVDYAALLGMEPDPSLMVQIQQADRTATDATIRIRSLLARRLLVADFVPAVTEDYENLGFQIRTRLRYLTAPDNNLAWGLEVPAPPNLPLASVDDRLAQDLLYSGTMDRKVSVDHLPAIELERGYVEVGTDRLTEIANPLFKIRDGAPRTVFSQEVHLYPWVKTLHRKQARIALRVHRELEQGAARIVYELDEVFPNERVSLRGLSIESESLTYSPFILGTPRLVPSRREIEISEPPAEGRPAELAPDDEIKRAVVNHVLEQILAAIERDVAQYPVEAIATTALEHQMQDRPLDAAETWGHFLAYVEALLAADLREQMEWIARRDAMRNRIIQWCSGRWSDQPESLRELVKEAWEQAVAAYRAAEFQ